jgi:hypothetical protein
MNGVPCICIDPHLLSLPHMDRSSAEEVEEFVSAVVDWARTADGKCTTAFVSSGVLDAIDDDGVFPWRANIIRILKQYRVISADHETVVTAIQSLLNSARIDEEIGLKALLLDASKTAIAPVFMQTRLRTKTQSAFADQLAMVALAQNGVGQEVDHIVLGSAPAGNDMPALAYVSFVTEVADIEWKSTPIGKAVVFPFAIDEKLSVFFSRNGLLEKIEPSALWPDGGDQDDARTAIDCCIARLVASGTSANDKIPYAIGTRFLQSAEQWGCGNKGRYNFTLIESCARIVLGIPKQDIGQFRDSVTGKQKLRTDGSVACRTHVTKRGAGLRLMFWRLPDGSIEFANVGDKDELAIL